MKLNPKSNGVDSQQALAATDKVSKPVIVMLDDDPFFLSSMARLLRSKGFETHCVNLWAKVPSAVRERRPDVVILDYNMPSLKGDQVCKALRDNGINPSMKIVMMSAEDSKRISGIALRCGADAFFPKSAPLDELVDGLRRLVSAGPRPRPRPAPAPVCRPAGTSIKKALVVENSGWLRGLVGKALAKSFGSALFEAATAGQAVEVLDQDPDMDLVVLDVSAPIREVLDLFARLGARGGRKPRVPVLLIGEEDMDFDIMRGMSLGARGYLIKPFTSADLVDKAREIFNTPPPDPGELASFHDPIKPPARPGAREFN